MLVKTWHLVLYLMMLLVSATICGGVLHLIRMRADSLLLDIFVSFVIMWLGMSLFAECFGIIESVEQKLQVLVDLLVHLCKMLHGISETCDRSQSERTAATPAVSRIASPDVSPDVSPPLCPMTAATCWMRNLKSETDVYNMQKKCT